MESLQMTINKLVDYLFLCLFICMANILHRAVMSDIYSFWFIFLSFNILLNEDEYI